MARAAMFNRSDSDLMRQEARRVTDTVRAEMEAYGLVCRAPAAARMPTNLPYDQVCQRYIQWCQATGRGGPTEYEVEQHAQRWYREQCARADPARGA
jgi:hypothetical protein